MKTLFTALLCLCLLALCACGRAMPEETTATTAITTAALITTTEPPTMPPIEYPASYKDAPEAYKPILDELYELAQLLRLDKSKVADSRGYGIWLFDSDYPEGSFGYAIVDINRDGVEELLMLRKDFWEWEHGRGPITLALFTLKDNKPVLLDAFWSRYIGNLTADGTIYVSDDRASQGRQLCSYKLNAGASELAQLSEYTCLLNERIPHTYFKGNYDNQQPITEEEYNELHEKYTNPPNPMPLNFITIEQ